MKKTVNKIMTICSVLFLLAGISACRTEAKIPEVKDLPLQHETEFGGVYLEMTIDDFNGQGFVYGDSVDVTFSNGYVLEDLPYYNGYYVDVGSPLLVAYPGYPYIKVGINNGEDLWKIADLKEDGSASVVLREHGTYLEMQLARDIHYTDIREDYPSDEAFANFRNVEVGDLKPGIFYRSASPCDNQHKRAPYVDRLIEGAGVQFILNLADTDEKIQGYLAKEDFASPYFLSLYESGQVLPIALNMNYGSEEFQQKLVNGLTAMAEQEGPYLIHCTEGKDRTGFVCMLLEALSGASYQEIVDDYMLTYDNYYEINIEKDPAKYDIILEKNLNDMIRVVVNDEKKDITKTDLKASAEAFLLRIGMAEESLAMLEGRLCKPATLFGSAKRRGMLPAFLIWEALTLLFLGIGLYVRRMQKPAAFFTFEKEGPKVSDVTAYNRSVSRLWILFALLFAALGGSFLFLPQNSPLFLLPYLGTVFLCLFLVISYTHIAGKYRK
ncbi:MAG: tyrosine-protein phosphatase [Erysipelotrichaceae bacterium]|nr:tyrosine-protein phosphatase [Erysipelotrichaceae bacterium]